MEPGAEVESETSLSRLQFTTQKVLFTSPCPFRDSWWKGSCGVRDGTGVLISKDGKDFHLFQTLDE